MRGIAPAFARAAEATGARPAPPPPRASPWVRDDRYDGLMAGLAWILVVLMIVPEGFDYALLATEESPESGRMFSRLLWLGLLGCGVAVIAWRARLVWVLTPWLNRFLLAFVFLATLSVVWSMDPPVTARRLIRVLTIVVASIAFVLVSWHARRFQNVLRPILTAALLGSIVFGLAWPGLAIHPETTGVLAGAWHGLTNHKNGLGDIASIGLILWCHAWLAREVRLLPTLLGGGAAIACLVLSRSSTALVAVAFTLLFMWMLMRSPRGFRPYMPYFVALFFTALLAYSLAFLNILPGSSVLLSPIGMLTGKDMSFTGRTDIWAILVEHIRLHPWLGTGYGAYWTGVENGAPSYEFILRLKFYPGSAHNGYLEVLNDLGAVGLLILLGYLGSFVAQSLRLLKFDRTQASLYLALFLHQAIANLAESRWFSALSVDFVIMTLATAALARALLEHSLRRYLGEPIRPAAPARPTARQAPTIGHVRPSLSHARPDVRPR